MAQTYFARSNAAGSEQFPIPITHADLELADGAVFVRLPAMMGQESPKSVKRRCKVFSKLTLV